MKSPVLHSFLFFGLTLALDKCPVADIAFVSNTKTTFAICPDSDYAGPTLQVFGNVPSAAACAQVCNDDGRCFKAVYDTETQWCHIKDNGAALPWVANGRYDAIRLNNNPPEGSVITTCPYTTSSYTSTNGAVFQICPHTDFRAGSVQVIGDVGDRNNCAQRCSATAGCRAAVYDRVWKSCHLKDASTFTATTWATNRQFDVLQIAPPAASSSTSRSSAVVVSTSSAVATPSASALPPPPPEGSVIANCPYQTSSYTSPSGAVFQICPFTDLRAASIQVINNIGGQTACAQRCGTTSGCRAAVYDRNNNVCHLKEPNEDAAIIWATNRQYDAIQIPLKFNPATDGKWSDIIRLPVIPVGVYAVPGYPTSNRILAFSSWGADVFSGDRRGYTQFADYNYVTGAVSQREVANTQHDMFCPGMSVLQDGRMVITGGNNAEVTTFYDPSTNAFTRGPDMKISRGYQTSTTLSDGKIFTIGGCYSGGITGKDQGVPFKNGEVYDPVANTWTLLNGADVRPLLTTDAEGPWRTDNHAWLFGWSNGSVFQAGPSPKQHWYFTRGTGSYVAAGTRVGADDQMCGMNVMYDVGKILSAGGSTDYSGNFGVANSHITTIGAPGTAVQSQRIADMKYPRALPNGVVLPDGSVLVTGGQRKGILFTDTDSFMVPELFNPTTLTWKTVARESVPRNYHAASVLLGDGRVWSGGGGLCYLGGNCGKQNDHADGQIYSPPYLFKSDGTDAIRPVISSLSTTAPKIGTRLTVTMNTSSATSFVLVRIGSATHSINSDQRRVPVSSTRSGNTHTLSLPTDSGILIPGNYFLFAISGGVPSISRTVRIVI